MWYVRAAPFLTPAVDPEMITYACLMHTCGLANMYLEMHTVVRHCSKAENLLGTFSRDAAALRV